MSEYFVTAISVSVSTGILIAALLLISPLVNKRYYSKWRFRAWAILALRLLIPISGLPESVEEPGILPQQTNAENYSFQEQNYEYPKYPKYPRLEINLPERLTEPIAVSGYSEKTAPERAVKRGISVLDLAAWIWIFGAGICFSVQSVGFIIYKRKIISHSSAFEDGEIYESFAALCRDFGVGKGPRPIYSPIASSPMIMGYLKPCLVLPRYDYSKEQLEFIIRHELTHYKRKDVWFKLLFALSSSLHWFNPLVWIMRRQADIDMELSTDEGVTENSDISEKIAYTEALLETAGNRMNISGSLSTRFGGGKRIMKKRFSNILSKINRKNGALLVITVTVLSVAAGMLIGCRADPEKITPELDSYTVKRLIDGDIRIRNFLKSSPPEHDETDNSELDGLKYYRVTDEAIDEYSEWKEALETVYAGEMLDKTLSDPAIIDIDGKSCCLEVRGYGIPTDYTYWQIKLSDIDGSGGRSAVIRTASTAEGGGYSSEYDLIYIPKTGWRISGIAPTSGTEEITFEETAILKEILKEASGEDEIYAFAAGDYDGDGSFEAFGATGEEYFDGKLWFVDEKGAEVVAEDGFDMSGSDGSHLLNFGREMYYVIEQSYGGSGGFSLVYGVKNGEWYENEISGKGESLAQIPGYPYQATIVDGSGFDGLTDEDGNDAGGHTYKTYYLYYDEKSKDFKEFGGLKISEEELTAYRGADEIIKEIKDSGAAIGDIFYRANGVININFYTIDPDGLNDNRNITLITDGNSVKYERKEFEEGVMKAAFLEEIATYPGGSGVPTE